MCKVIYLFCKYLTLFVVFDKKTCALYVRWRFMRVVRHGSATDMEIVGMIFKNYAVKHINYAIDGGKAPYVMKFQKFH